MIEVVYVAITIDKIKGDSQQNLVVHYGEVNRTLLLMSVVIPVTDICVTAKCVVRFGGGVKYRPAGRVTAE